MKPRLKREQFVKFSYKRSIFVNKKPVVHCDIDAEPIANMARVEYAQRKVLVRSL